MESDDNVLTYGEGIIDHKDTGSRPRCPLHSHSPVRSKNNYQFLGMNPLLE